MITAPPPPPAPVRASRPAPPAPEAPRRARTPRTPKAGPVTPVRPAEASTPVVGGLGRSRPEAGPLPRFQLPSPPPAPPAATVVLTPMTEWEFKRATDGGRRVLCASCRYADPMPAAELGYACRRKANECVPQSLGKLYESR